MPIAAKERIESLVTDLGSRAEVARALHVDRSQVTRWLDRGQDPGPENVRKVEGVELALARLLRQYDRASALAGSRVSMPLGWPPADRPAGPRPSQRGPRRDRRRRDRVVRLTCSSASSAGCPTPRRIRSGSRANARAAVAHDDPDRYTALYLAREPVGAVAEAIQAFRGQELTAEALVRPDGARRSLATIDDTAIPALLDLDDPRVLVARRLRPSAVATGIRRADPADRGPTRSTAARSGCPGGRPSRRRGRT